MGHPGPKTTWIAVAVAGVTALGSVGKAFVDAHGADKVQLVVAAEVARNEQRWSAVERLIEAQADTGKDMTSLREAVAALKVSADLLSRNRNTAAREAAGGAHVPAPKAAKPVNASADVDDSRVQAMRDKLFNGSD